MKSHNLSLLAVIKLSFLNIIKNQRKTGVAFITMIVGIIALVSMGGFIQFNFEGLREATIRTQLGHFQIYKTGYRENSLKDPYKYLIEDYKKLSLELKENVYDVDTVTQRLYFSGLIAYNNLTFSALFIGINPSIEQGFSSAETIIDGMQIDDDDSNQAVIGEILAQSLGVSVGDYISVLTNTIDGTINVIDLQVQGIARTGSKEY
ncbi:MAG: ABC transporter permease, partial [Alphaproteobacteria bacterium]|nr:ABC transporter permease [Alphaproteobacteria bacterium]